MNYTVCRIQPLCAFVLEAMRSRYEELHTAVQYYSNRCSRMCNGCLEQPLL